MCGNSNDDIFIIWSVPTITNDIRASELMFMISDINGNILLNQNQLTYDNLHYDKKAVISSDSLNHIHIKWQKQEVGNYYATLSYDGTILTNATPLDNVTAIPGYPVVKDDLGNLIYLDKDGVVDSENNIHVFTKHEEGCCDTYKSHLSYEKISENGTILDQQIIYSNTYMGNPDVLIDTQNNIHLVWKEGNNIYYTKLDNNGNILIDRMLIVSGKVEKEEATPGFGLIPLIMVVVVVAAVMRRRS